MDMVDRIPGLDETALVNLRQNALRLANAGGDLRAQQAATLLPLIESELATRKLAKAKVMRVNRLAAAAEKAESRG